VGVALGPEWAPDGGPGEAPGEWLTSRSGLRYRTTVYRRSRTSQSL
jgi:hypothetical protein